MKTLLALTLAFYLAISNIVFAQTNRTYVIFNPNNTSTYLVSSGIFNNDIRTPNTQGFMWPVGSDRFCGYSAGLIIAAKVNGALRMASASYNGEYSAGCIQNGSPYYNSDFKFYKVNRGNGPSNPDWANWYKMVPYGAPYIDINLNGIYDQGIDTPGVKSAQQTIFICMTDGFSSVHTITEGFAGGTQPLYAEVHLTAWGYNNNGLSDVQFLKWEILNKGNETWDSTFFSIFCHATIGSPGDDYIGSDSVNQIGYWYNSDNMDGSGTPPSWGLNPPAAGMLLLQGALKKSPLTNYKMTSFVALLGSASCEGFPNGMYQNEVHNLLSGHKRDGSNFMNPSTVPHKPSKYCFSGYPEYFGGWTDPNWIHNCGIDSGQTGTVNDTLRYFLMNSGSNDLSVSPTDTQKIIIAQFAARGTNNRNAITRLNTSARSVQTFYNANFVFRSISGNVRYSDNNQLVTSGLVKALRYDWVFQTLTTLDSAYIQTDGSYFLSHVPLDSVYIGLYPVTAPVRDFVPGYYPSSIYWHQAIVLYPVENLININSRVNRLHNYNTENSISGRVFGINNPVTRYLPDAVLYAVYNNDFVGWSHSETDGTYDITSIPAGNIKVIADRIGYKADSCYVNLSDRINIDSVNFRLYNIYVGIHQNGNLIPEKYTLSQNYPNPFNPITSINFDLPVNGMVSLKVYNLLGQEVATLANQSLSAGKYTAAWDASSFPSGVYFYRMEVMTHGGFKRSFVQSGKMILLK